MPAFPAWSHEPVGGLQGLVSGFTHPLSEPAQALLLLAASLWAGQAMQVRLAAVLPILGISLLCGALFGLVRLVDPAPASLVALAIACILGLASAARLAPPAGILMPSLVAAAAVAGIVCVPDPGPLGAVVTSSLGALFGAILLVSVVVPVVRWSALPARAVPLGIAIRVAGSWIAAASLMAGALAFTNLAGVAPAG